MPPAKCLTEPRSLEPVDVLLWLTPGKPYQNDAGGGVFPPHLAGLALDLAGRSPLVWPVTLWPPADTIELMVRPTQADECQPYSPGFKVYGLGYFKAECIRTETDADRIRQRWRVTAGQACHLFRMLVVRFGYAIRVAGKINPPCPLTYAARKAATAGDGREWSKMSAGLLLTTLEGIRNGRHPTPHYAG